MSAKHKSISEFSDAYCGSAYQKNRVVRVFFISTALMGLSAAKNRIIPISHPGHCITLSVPSSLDIRSYIGLMDGEALDGTIG
jgi:hypothetical protein